MHMKIRGIVNQKLVQFESTINLWKGLIDRYKNFFITVIAMTSEDQLLNIK